MIDEKKLLRYLSDWWLSETPRGDGTILFINGKPQKTPMMKAIEDFMRVVEEQPKVGEWIPVSERLPDNEQEVEITYVNKHWKTGEPLYFTCRAFYTDGTMNTEESDYVWNETDNWEYNEKLDAYIIPEGWWERVSFAEEFGVIDKPVIAWQPLPEPYEEQNNG